MVNLVHWPFLHQGSNREMAKLNKRWSALFVDSLSTDCAVFMDRLPAFRPAEVARLCIETKKSRIGHFLAALGLVPALTASIGSQLCLANKPFAAN